ncbi:hypothetical protein [Allochromatium vinosum]|uniref:hypothetical protein n=1 Tax=Allochromatium vinosum TaxID=1049 RepID=UPI001906540F|nr:hypothetical protein [Allochromatium vinosum]
MGDEFIVVGKNEGFILTTEGIVFSPASSQIQESAPDESEPDLESLPLFPAERRELGHLAADCRLQFPCTIPEARRWALDFLGIDPPDTPILVQRERALIHFLESRRIPRDDWHYLKTRHGFTRQSLYQALLRYPEFKTLSQGSFCRKFLIEQRLAKLK